VALGRVAAIWHTWAELDSRIAAQVALFETFEEGAKVYPLVFLPADRRGNKVERCFVHAIHYAAITRHTSSPTLFAIEGQHAIRFRKPPAEPAGLPEIIAHYDYVWCYNPDEATTGFLDRHCTRVAGRDGALVFRTPAR
jgi:hypothetical protein